MPNRTRGATRGPVVFIAGLLMAATALVPVSCGSGGPAATNYVWKMAYDSPLSLQAICAVDPGHTWALGYREVESVQPPPPGDQNRYEDYNYRETGTTYRTAIYFFDGQAWTTQAEVGGRLSRLFALDAANVWAAGAAGVYYFNGSAWSLSAYGPDTYSADYQDVSGYEDLRGLLANPPPVSVMTENGFLDVTAIDGTHAWGVTENYILAFNGTAWNPVLDLTESDELQAVSAADATHVWACGSSSKGSTAGRVFAFNGSSWLPQYVGPSMVDIEAVDATHVWAIGGGGEVLFFNGSRWSLQENLNVQLSRIAAADPTHAWILADENTIFFWNGEMWGRQYQAEDAEIKTSGGKREVEVSTRLRGICAMNTEEAWAAGGTDVSDYSSSDETPEAAGSIYVGKNEK